MRFRQRHLRPHPRHHLHIRETDVTKISLQRYHSVTTAVAWNIGLALIVLCLHNLRPMQEKLCGRSAMMKKVLPTNMTNSTLNRFQKIFKRNESVDDEILKSDRLDNGSLRPAVTQRAVPLLKHKALVTVVHNSCEEVGRRRSYLRRPLNSRTLKMGGLMSARRHQPVKEHTSLSLKRKHRKVRTCLKRR